MALEYINHTFDSAVSARIFVGLMGRRGDGASVLALSRQTPAEVPGGEVAGVYNFQ